MTDFNSAVNFVLKHEGKYYHDPVTGEESNFGISKAFLELVKYEIRDPKLITENIAKTIYKQWFWTPYNLEKFNSQLVANKVMDMIVNMGPKSVVKILQACLNSLGASCVIDGIMGPHTLIVVNQFLDYDKNSEDRLLEELRIKCGAYYRGIAIGANAKNLIGWLNRANDLGEGAVTNHDTLRDGSTDRIIKT